MWAYYRVPSQTISDNDFGEIEEYKQRLANMMLEIRDYYELDLRLVPEDMRLKERYEALEEDYSAETSAIGKRYDERANYVLGEELGETTQYGFVVGVKLHNNDYLSQQNFKDSVKKAVENVTTTALYYLGANVQDTKKAFTPFFTSEKEVFSNLSSLKPERLSDKRLYYMTIRPFRLGMPHSELPKTLQVTNTTLDAGSDSGYLRLISEYGESTISLLTIANTEVNITYDELFKLTQQLPFAVELTVKLSRIRPNSASRKTEMTSKRFKETDKEMYQNEDSDDVIVQGKELLNDLRNKINNEHEPFYNWLACFTVTGANKEEVKEKSRALKSFFANYKVEVTQPMADQLALFYKMLNGNSITMDRYWLQNTTYKGVAEMLFGLSDRLGSNVGFYIGRVTHGNTATTEQAVQNSRDIVLFQPLIANEGIEGATTDSPHLAITGETGKGKSFLAKLLMFYMTFLDVQILMTDPKNENQSWFEEAIKDPQTQEEYPYFVELMKSFHYVTLDPSNPQNYGVLDPLTFLQGAQAKDTAMAIIEQVYNLTNKDDIKRAILEDLEVLLEKKEQGETVGMMNLIEDLQQDENRIISEAGGLLKQLVNNSILQLAFSDGTTQGLNIKNKHTILSIQGLDLPTADTKFEEMNDNDRKALAVMIPLAKFCQYFGQKDRRQKTSIIFDEAWTLTAARGGKRLIKELRRAGRSYNNQLIMITQSVKDTQSEDDNGNFGCMFAFDNPAERTEILKSMDLPDTKENRSMLANLKNGQCLFKDFYGRVDTMSVDCLYPEWSQAFKTVDQSHSAQAERKFA